MAPAQTQKTGLSRALIDDGGAASVESLPAPTGTDARRLTQAERTDRSDSAMLACAIALVVERGPALTTLKDVGEGAGFSRGLAGQRFGSKDGLFEFMVRSIGEAWLIDLTRATEGLIGQQAIDRALDEHLRFCVEAPDQFLAFYRLWFEAIGEESAVRSVVSNIHERRRRDIARWIAAGKQAGDIAESVSSAAVAGQFTASVIGIVYYWLQHPEDIDEVAALHMNLKTTIRNLLSVSDASENFHE